MPKGGIVFLVQVGAAVAVGGSGYLAGLPPPEAVSLGLITLMAISWTSESLPYYVVALLPLLSVPLLEAAGVSQATTLWQAYGQPVIGLFLGSFWLARAVEVHALPLYLRGKVIHWAKGNTRRLFVGLMGLSAGMSTLLNNTAVTALLLPVVQRLFPEGPARWQAALSIAWAASLGGVITLTGSAPNGIVAQLLAAEGLPVGFLQWMGFGLFAGIGGLAGAYLLLHRQRESPAASHSELPSGEPVQLTLSGKRTALVLALTLAGWVWAPLPVWSVALLGAFLLFLPGLGERGAPLLTLQEGLQIPWGILWLFGGGLALARLVELSGLGTHFTAFTGPYLQKLPPALFWFVVIGLAIWPTELLSNTALCALLLPLLLPIFEATQRPLLGLIWFGIGTSMAFMLPVATPPNALAYSEGSVPLRFMRRRGLQLNIFMHLFLTAAATLSIG